MSSEKNYKKITLYIVFFYFFLLSFSQFYNQHWTSILDQDPIIIYNSLLISSGFEQEYRDHPAYTTFLILGGIFKLLSIFFENFKLNELLLSDNIDQKFQLLFYISRIINTFCIFLSIFLLSKILEELKTKKITSIICIMFASFFLATYELLYLIRSEIISLMLLLVSIYYFLKFIKKENLIYSIFCGIFFALAILAKVQIIFLIFIFIVSIPFLFIYLKDNLDISVNKKFYSYKTGIFIISIFIVFFLLYQVFLGIIFFKETNDETFFLTNNVDFYFFIAFVIFYRLLTYILNKKKLINSELIIISLSSIIIGFILCLMFIFFLDFVNLIPAHKSIFIRILSPIEFMSMHTYKARLELVNIFVSIKEYLILGFYGLSYDFNDLYDPKIFSIKNRVFFRICYLILILTLLLISIRKLKSKKIVPIISIFSLGVIIYYLLLNIRETHGYNIYLLPLYIFIIAIIFTHLNKKNNLIFGIILLSITLFENYNFIDIHKNAFTREPRVADICKLKNWENSKNYFNDKYFSSHIKLVYPESVDGWLFKYLNKFFTNKEGFKNYCLQVKNYNQNKINFYFKKF